LHQEPNYLVCMLHAIPNENDCHAINLTGHTTNENTTCIFTKTSKMSGHRLHEIYSGFLSMRSNRKSNNYRNTRKRMRDSHQSATKLSRNMTSLDMFIAFYKIQNHEVFISADRFDCIAATLTRRGLDSASN